MMENKNINPKVEKMIETIAKAYQSKSTTELEQLLKDYDDSIYTTEAFEAMRRIITSRESEMRADIGKNIKFGENQEKIFQSKREEQRKNEYQKDLNRMLDESSTVLKSIKSLRAKRKIYFGVGTAIFLMALMISIFTRDWSTVKQWMIMIFVILGFPVGFNILKARKFAKKQIDLDDGVKNLSEKIRCSEEKSCGSLLSALQTEV